MPALALPAFWLAVGSTAAATGTIYAANRTANANLDAAQITTTAANHAADVQGQSNADALAEQRRQADLQQANFDATERANYEQWAAREQRMSAIGEMLGLPARNIPAFVPTTHPSSSTSGGSGGTGTSGGNSSGGTATMPQGIDPRFAALYQRFGVTPGGRGSGPSDWQYYQNDAVRNANGDVNYVLGRLEQDLSGRGGSGTTTVSRPQNTLSAFLGSAAGAPYGAAPNASQPTQGGQTMPYLRPNAIAAYLG